MLYNRQLDGALAAPCLLCVDAPCAAACGRLAVDRLLRSLRLDNEIGAAMTLGDTLPCADCDAPCQRACLLPEPLPVKRILTQLHRDKQSMEPIDPVGVDLTCNMCGIPLENPFLLSASVVSGDYAMLERAFSLGWAGAVCKTMSLLPSYQASPRFAALRDEQGAYMGLKNLEQLSDHTVEENLTMFRQLKKVFPTKVLIASILGRDEDEWRALSQMVTEAGADAIELNFAAVIPDRRGDLPPDGVGERLASFVRAARLGSRLPMLAKLSPNVGDVRPIALEALENGADGVTAVNTLRALTGVNLDTYTASPSVRGKSAIGGYSGRAVKPIAMRFIAELMTESRLRISHISASGGVQTWRDAAEFLLMGASSVQVTTAVMLYGYRVIDDLVQGLRAYMAEKGFRRLYSLIGLAAPAVVTADELSSASIVYPVHKEAQCLGCGRCALSCMDAGPAAITMRGEDRKPCIDTSKCTGCHLCVLVCPRGAMLGTGKRVPLA